MIHQQQACPFGILARVESHNAVLAVVAAAGESRLHGDGATKLFRSGRDIERVDTLKIGRRRILAHRDYVDCSVRAAGSINDRGRSNSDLWIDLAAAVVIGGRLPRTQY